jgi:signal transduction histidine kinase
MKGLPLSDGAHWFDRIAHDLRGPLSPLQTAAWLLKSDAEKMDPERRRELVEIIERQSRRLARMVDELGDWSRAQQARLLGAREPCPLQHLVDLAVGAIPGCGIEPDVGGDCAGLQVDCDQHRLVQALKSLLEYALAHGDAALSMGCVDGVARIGILAGGVPVDAESLPRLLAQPDPAPFDEGLGLRLLLARAIIEAHGGTLSATTDAAGKLRLACTLPAS